jgi:seryl-tRNA synthetase
MIDLQLLRQDPEKYKIAAKQKGYDVDIDELLRRDESRRSLLAKVEELRRQRNENASKLKSGRDEKLIIEGKKIKDELSIIEETLKETENSWLELLKKVPNLPLDDVPVGSSEDDNVESRVWGEKTQFDFEPKSHWQIAEERGLIDKTRAAKVSGSRFAYLKGPLVEMQFALIQFVLAQVTDMEVIKKIITDNKLDLKDTPFVPILPPVLIKEDVYDQMDRLEPREDRYHIDGEDDSLWLIGSAEHTLGSMYKDEILSEKDLPFRYIGYSTSFRQEAGTYGKDTEGIIRMHQFDKLEFETFSTAETGLHEHYLMIAMQEYLTQQLEMPYHLLNKCTADIGKPNARGVDLEMWMPGQGKYRETHTADYMTDYQARRLQTRVRRDDKRHFVPAPEVNTSELGSIDPTRYGSKVPVELVHTNDATAFAMGRTLVAIIENNQLKDGYIKVPKVLQKYMGGREKI